MDTARGGATVQQGFTLLEIMVVVLLIAITATYAVVNLQRDDDRLAELELRRLAGFMEQLREESELAGRLYAVEFTPAERTYRFLQLGNEGWQPFDSDDLFREGQVPEPLVMVFKGSAVPGGAVESDMVVFMSDGSISPFELMLTGKRRVYRLYLDPAQNLLTDSDAIEKG